MLALAEYEAAVCECGFHESVADEDPALRMDIRVCPVCSDLAKNLRIIDDRDKAEMKQYGEKPAAESPRPDDGRHIRLLPAIPTT